MRRADREISDRNEIDSIILGSKVCRLALCDKGMPYIVPLCFGYEVNRLYFHCASEGKKLDIIRENPSVSFEMDTDQELVTTEEGCGCSMRYRSVIGSGKAVLISEFKRKKAALDVIMTHYGLDPCDYPESMLDKTSIIEVKIEDLTGKKSGY